MEIKEIALLTVKAEGTYGTDPTPTTLLNAIPTIGDSLTWNIQANVMERRINDGQHGKLPSFKTLPNVELKFGYELRSNDAVTSGSISDKVEIDCLLLAANLEATYTAESIPDEADGFVVYKPSMPTTVGPSVTCYWYTQTKLHKLLGGKVTFKIIAEAGKPARIEFTVKGKYVEPEDTAFPASATFDNTVKPAIYRSSFTSLGGVSGLVFSKFEFDAGLNVIMRPGATAEDGIQGFAITAVDPKVKLDPEAVAEGTLAIWNAWKQGTVHALSTTIGDSYGNMITVTANCEYQGVGYGEREKIRTQELDMNCVRSAMGDDVDTLFSIKFA